MHVQQLIIYRRWLRRLPQCLAWSLC